MEDWGNGGGGRRRSRGGDERREEGGEVMEELSKKGLIPIWQCDETFFNIIF